MNTKKRPNQKVKVLYQNLNGIWYAFADVDTHIFVGRVPFKAQAPESAQRSGQYSEPSVNSKKKQAAGKAA